MNLEKLISFLKKRFGFVDRFIKKYRYVEVFVHVLLYSLLFVYFWRSTSENFIGLLIFLTGLILWIESLKDIGSSFSGFPETKKLVTTGMYAKFGHPIYYSGTLMDIGLVIYTQNLVILIIVLFVFIIQLIRIHEEEKVLIKKFGKRYKIYKRKTIF